METKAKTTSDAKGQPKAGLEEKKIESLLNKQLNVFLINYFNYLALALAVVIFASGLFLFVYPRYKNFTAGNEKTEKNQQAEYAVKSDYLKAIRELKDSYRLIGETDRKKIEDMAPASDKVISLIPEIESIVLKNGAILNSIKIEESFKKQSSAKTDVGSGEKPVAGVFGELPKGIGYARAEISLSSVNYPVLKNLLKTFENNLRLLDVAKVDYDVENNRANFTIYSYYLLP